MGRGVPKPICIGANPNYYLRIAVPAAIQVTMLSKFDLNL